MDRLSEKFFGFTLIEVLVVLSLFAVAATLSVTGFQNFASYQQYKQAVVDVKSVLSESQVSARSAVKDKSHGIKFSTNSLTKFEGPTYSAVSSTNKLISYKLVTIQANLTGGVDQIVFSKLSGIPSVTGNIVVTGTRYSESTTIQISSAGVIQ